MNAKTITTGALLLFVAASVVYLIVSESGTADGSSTATLVAENDRPVSSAPADKVVAYYFYNTQRCATCLKIERQAREALREEFSEACAAGRLEWRAVNMQESPNEHFVKDYELVTSSLVLVKVEGGAPAEWQRMDRVWELVDDPLNFHVYVTEQAREYLEH